MISVAHRATLARSLIKQSCCVLSAARTPWNLPQTTPGSSSQHTTATMSTAPTLPTIATKTHGIERSVWWVTMFCLCVLLGEGSAVYDGY